MSLHGLTKASSCGPHRKPVGVEFILPEFTHRNWTCSLHHKWHDSAALGEFESGKALGSFVTPDVVDITKLDRAKTVTLSVGCED